MILSFHPCYEADANIICAGREPDEKDLAVIRTAEAVILPQGCRESLYRLSRQHCRHVFPDYDMRFNYPGKTGQARLFRALAVPHPETWPFDDLSDYAQRAGRMPKDGLPLVFKLDWGGEGETVVLIRSAADLEAALSTAAAYERSGQRGFILQRFVPGTHRTLRVAVTGKRLTAYWRIQENLLVFGTSVAHGARIDHDSDPLLRQAGLDLARDFCRRSKINLAGFDLIFENTQSQTRPLFLEINYFFGRTGLGGSDAFYTMLKTEIDGWLEDLGLSLSPAVKNERPDTIGD
ncbi:ATP-grasp domain-containing protein [Desulfosarcina ovata]|uniref:ATP-grasp domain-containing protein n=1 Tax=Desulfosarcina ovata subsp. ovata TaxID=2752305 RepID=A0A5K8AEU7_9BACT|nr:glutathione synthase [Desulfosarcina ovata]BBO90460.1 hypothetical protein DSCOOX_36400 [Desulfosarcina ovata subsp. ovata]